MTDKIDIVIAACPKPFISSFIDIQTNAVDSWVALKQAHPNVNVHIYLIGDETNVDKVCEFHKLNHIKDVKKNAMGTPLISDIFKIIQSIDIVGSTSVYCYVNCDIVLMPDFVHTINNFIKGRRTEAFGKTLSRSDYLIVGQRIDVDTIPRLFNMSNLDQSYSDLLNIVKSRGVIHSPEAMDYFIFPRGAYPFIYDFAIGKLVWDAWLTGNAYRRGLMTLDASKTITAIHQDGDWYQADRVKDSGDVKRAFVKTREELEKSEEVLINQSFDYYEKNCKSGTTWEIDFNNDTNAFVFKRKQIIADED